MDRGVWLFGIIGNRLLHDSPRQANNPYGPVLGQAGLTRFARDVLAQSGVKYVFVCLGVNDILFPAFPFTPPTERAQGNAIPLALFRTDRNPHLPSEGR